MCNSGTKLGAPENGPAINRNWTALGSRISVATASAQAKLRTSHAPFHTSHRCQNY